MSNIGNYSSTSSSSSYVKKESYTDEVKRFVEYLHKFMPTIIKEYDDLEKRREAKPCKAFDDKLKGLNDIYLAEKALYYWYVEQPKGKQQ